VTGDIRKQPEPDRLVIVPDGQGRSIVEEYDWPESAGDGGPVKRATRKPKRGRLGTPEVDRG
jgi:hypothetical protein